MVKKGSSGEKPRKPRATSRSAKRESTSSSERGSAAGANNALDPSAVQTAAIDPHQLSADGFAGGMKSLLLGKLEKTGERQVELSKQFSSVFDIAGGTVDELLACDKRMHIAEARALHEQAKAMTVMTARRFRENRLVSPVRRAFEPGIGIRGLVDSPTWNDLFNPDWHQMCPTDAIEANTSPVAYLTDLYREVKEIEKRADAGRNFPLASRRSDLAGLTLDHTALNRIQPTIVLVNEILEATVRKHLDDKSQHDKLVDDALLEARYPSNFPYERYQDQINYVLGRKDRLPGDAIRCADIAYPYFKEPGVHSYLSDTALVQDTGLGPVQQGLLLEAPHFPDVDQNVTANNSHKRRRIHPRTRLIETKASNPAAFFRENFGEYDFNKLLNTQTFCLQTGLKTEELESLLSVGAYAPYRSANVEGEESVNGAVFGSVYVNAGRTPAMGIESLDVADGPSHRLTAYSHDRFDRLNRMIRLARWLKLPFDDVDRLLSASITVERKGTDHLITPDTVRALGLFQWLRNRFKVTVDDFAALLDGLAVHARGKAQSQFDRVFNSQALFPIPLMLDNQAFVITPRNGNDLERIKVDHLCAALGMTYEAYRFVAKVIEQAHGDEPLRWNRELVSAFYRLVRLPRYLGLTSVEVLALLELLDGGGSQLVSKLAGPAHVASYQSSGHTDTLSVIHALADCSLWLKEHQWTVAQLCRMVMPPLTKPVASDAELNLLRQMHQRLEAALITDSSFAEVGAPDTRTAVKLDPEGRAVFITEPIDWFNELNGYIDDGGKGGRTTVKGLVLFLADAAGTEIENFEEILRNQVAWLLDKYDLPPEELLPRICTMIMRARGAQEALLMEGLAGYLGCSADLAKALLAWAGGNRFDLLKEVLWVFGGEEATRNELKVEIGDEVLLTLDGLSKRGLLATHLQLSPALIAVYTAHPAWFGLDNADLTLPSVYALTCYAATLRLSENSEDELLDYFRLINSVWGRATLGDKRLIRDNAAEVLAGFLKWGVREVLTGAFHLSRARDKEEDRGVVFNLRELDLLVRLCLLGRHTGLDAKALLALGTLTPTTLVEDYRYAAELALSSLTEALPGTPAGEVGQSYSSTFTVTPDYLVARNEADRATYTLILRDFMDQPYDNVTVTWKTNLGVPSEQTSLTDEQGQASLKLGSGTVMGNAQVVAEFGLGKSVYAPVVSIGCDEQSLHLYGPEVSSTTAQSNRRGAIKFSIRLKDDYGNEGIDRAIEWGTTLGEFERYTTLTDHSGVSTALLRSKPKGEARVIAQYGENQGWPFDPVEFTSVPYFEYVRFADTAVAGVPVEVSCRLVEQDGVTPVVGKPIYFTCEFSEEYILDPTGFTDENGVARTRFKSPVPINAVVVGVYTTSPIEKKWSASTRVYPQATIVKHEASGSEYLVGNPQPLVFSIWLNYGEEVASRTPVVWSVDGVEVARNETDTSGKATFSSRFPLGGHKVKATVAGTSAAVEFPVSAAYPPIVIRDHEVSRQEYLVGDPNPVEFRVRLRMGAWEAVPPETSVRWSWRYLGVPVSGQSKSDAATGIAKAQPNLYGIGKHVVTATVFGTNEAVEFPEVTVAYPPVKIVASQASSLEYLVGNPTPLSFTVTLRTVAWNGVPPRAETVNWSIDEGPIISSRSDSTGIARFSSKFEPGEHVVEATVAGTTETARFTVSARHDYEFRVTLSGPQDGQAPDLLSRGSAYTLNVKAIDKYGGLPIEGIVFTMKEVGSSLAQLNINISGINQSFSSTLSGRDFTIQGAYHVDTVGSFTLKIETPSHVVWQKTYKMGHIFVPHRGLRVEENFLLFAPGNYLYYKRQDLFGTGIIKRLDETGVRVRWYNHSPPYGFELTTPITHNYGVAFDNDMYCLMYKSDPPPWPSGSLIYADRAESDDGYFVFKQGTGMVSKKP